MATMNLSVWIAAPPESVFAVITDFENSPERIDWYDKVEILTEGPIGIGTRWRETRSMNKQQSIEEWEITAFNAPQTYSAYCDSQGYDINLSMNVAPETDGSRLSLIMSTTPRTMMGKLMTPIEWMMSGMMKSIVRKDLENTKAFIEGNKPRT